MQAAIARQHFHKFTVRIHEDSNGPRAGRKPVQQAAQGAGRDAAGGSLVQHKSQVIRPRVQRHAGVRQIGQAANFDFGCSAHSVSYPTRVLPAIQ